jgi:uncharacterized membrane protein YcaP (DUF421 family)
LNLDWQQLFGLSVPPLEMVVRGTAMYWFLFLLFRVVIRRRVGAVGISDMLLLVIIADAAQNAMAGEYRTVTDGCILVGTIVAWNVLIDWLTYASPALQKLFEPPPLLLIHRGRLLRRHLRHELITEEELSAKLRASGIDNYAEVDKAYIETDGQVTVIRRAPSSSPR